MSGSHIIGAFALIFDNQGRLLICHRRDHDVWDVPGGGVEPGESPWDGVRREVLEEVNIEIEECRLAVVQHKPLQNEITFGFVARTEHPRPSLSDEVRDVMSVPVTQLPERFHREQRMAIRAVEQANGDGIVTMTINDPCPREFWLQGVWS
ncbi:MAG: NUDIX hydrolase [Pseudomonadota bacterium]